jgi:hypothetical protein
MKNSLSIFLLLFFFLINTCSEAKTIFTGTYISTGFVLNVLDDPNNPPPFEAGDLESDPQKLPVFQSYVIR